MIKKITSLKGIKKLTNKESKNIHGGIPLNQCFLDCINDFIECINANPNNSNCISFRSTCYSYC